MFIYWGDRQKKLKSHVINRRHGLCTPPSTVSQVVALIEGDITFWRSPGGRIPEIIVIVKILVTYWGDRQNVKVRFKSAP